MAKIYLHPFSDAVIALSAFFLLSLLTLDMSRGKYLDALFGMHFFASDMFKNVYELRIKHWYSFVENIVF